jgi:hypothetical protein
MSNIELLYNDDLFSIIKKQYNSDSKQLFKQLLLNSTKINTLQDFTKLVKHEDFDEYSR